MACDLDYHCLASDAAAFVGVHLVGCTNLPKMDVVGKSDPYVLMWFTDGDKQVGKRVEWKVKKKTLNPVWNETRLDFGLPQADLERTKPSLHLEVWDHDFGSKDDNISKMDIPYSDLPFGDCAEVKLVGKHCHKNSAIQFCVVKNHIEGCEKHGKVLQDVFFLKLIGSMNVPKIDKMSESDPFVVARLVKEMNKKDQPPLEGTSVVSWPVKNDCPCPVWNTCRSFTEASVACLTAMDAVVHLELWDSNVGKDEKIGSAFVRVTDLVKKDWPTSIKVECRKKQKEECTLQVQAVPCQPLRKTVFFIRHGESKWNKAQEDRDLKTMSTMTDHPLNEVGIQQAKTLQEKVAQCIREPSQYGENSSERLFIDATQAFCSPLTRAIETCLIGTAPVLAKLGKLTLLANAREKRNFGGKDSSGDVKGADILTKVKESLAEFLGEEDATKLTSVDIDLSEVQSRWWTDSAENGDEMESRISEFLNVLQFSPHRVIIVTGHSHFFREILGKYQHPSLTSQFPAQAEKLHHVVMENCGVVRVDFDFRSQLENSVVGLEPVFGSKMKG
eukprot:CAMPEP_0177658384 /NCGR_PEP_ID=MMETSP0447-20121125/16772_1 /TAXON_ID=0 /ORGANISM="Stygamoeba regulata, Strain BSH-02190019" /LENGTH=557 /DNA_ID=CAMNT_0019162967 /DNA_START=76 /DNA_END=1749 /DNA_ORIENTATION=+